MIGGLVSSTILTLIVIPVVFYIWKNYELNHLSSKTDVDNQYQQTGAQT